MKKEKVSFRNRYWNYMDKHPKLSVFLNSLDAMNNRAMLVYTIILAVIMIGIPVVVVYCTLPEGVRGELSAICGTLLSVVVMPLVLNNYNRKRDNIDKRYEKNSALYEELADILEVVYALTEDLGHTRQELETVYNRKHEARGGFRDRIFLISKE